MRFTGRAIGLAFSIATLTTACVDIFGTESPGSNIPGSWKLSFDFGNNIAGCRTTSPPIYKTSKNGSTFTGTQDSSAFAFDYVGLVSCSGVGAAAGAGGGSMSGTRWTNGKIDGTKISFTMPTVGGPSQNDTIFGSCAFVGTHAGNVGSETMRGTMTCSGGSAANITGTWSATAYYEASKFF